MNKYKITWSPKAYHDLQNIYNYIAFYLNEKSTAKNLIQKILKSILNLNYSPECYIKIQNFDDNAKNIRKMLVDNYVVIYQVDKITRTGIYITYIS